MLQLGEKEGLASRIARRPCPIVFCRLDRDGPGHAAAQELERRPASQARHEDGPALAGSDGRGVDRDGLALKCPGSEERKRVVLIVVRSGRHARTA